MRTVVVLAEAAEDIERGRDFYDEQEPGVGDYFADAIIADIASLALYHGIHSRHSGFYRMLAHRFPFGIYYRDTEKETQVFAVLDLRRDPNWIRKELVWRG
ncbi:MAG TPA: type II toxin-antitoxin system RelE/ParE family toxin [Verrucomicrobiae bacterium]|jgi:plasmid stabilization system protein ParE